MKVKHASLAAGVSLSMLCSSHVAWAQSDQGARPTQPDDPAPPPGGRNSDAAAQETQDDVIVVTGIRASLESAARIKRDSDQVVDSIVADDIGKFPDSTVAAALQRVPGVQVLVGTTSQIDDPLVRGLEDIETTLNGREAFFGTSRGFEFQYLPAEVLAGADVYKSNTADLIEGGVAGYINLKLRRPFDFEDGLTIAGSARATYSIKAEQVSPSASVLVARRWETGIGDVGVLLNGAWSSNYFNRPIAYVGSGRSSEFAGSPAAGSNAYLPGNFGAVTEAGVYQIPQVNFAVQWEATPELEVLVDGLWTANRRSYLIGRTTYNLFDASSITNIQTDENCVNARVDSNGYFDPNSTTVQSLCRASSLTANEVETNVRSEAQHRTEDLFIGGVGLEYESGRFLGTLDVSAQHSTAINEGFIFGVGEIIDSVAITTEDDGSFNARASGDALSDPSVYTVVGGYYEYRERWFNDQYAIKADGKYDTDGLLDYLQAGLRFTDRDVGYRRAAGGPGSPAAGDYVVPVSSLGFGDDFYEYTAVQENNDGAEYAVPSRAALFDADVQQTIREFYNYPKPENDPAAGFDASEKVYAGYLQGRYEVPVSDAIRIDGLIGARLSKVDRQISGAGTVNGEVVPVERSTSETDALPNASARLGLGPNFQMRATYGRTVSRPPFSQLDPGLSYVPVTDQDPDVIGSGDAGNPDLRSQKADAFDLTAEYYFSRGGYIAVGGFYKSIKDRVVNEVRRETIDTRQYDINRPRNIGSANLYGVELSTQFFFDFLPGALSGFGMFGNYTIVESEVTTETDRLYGYPLQGVSRDNWNLGLIYEQLGLNGRLVYTYRSSYFDYDLSGAGSTVHEDEIFLNWVKPNGRLDFSVGYDITPMMTVSVDGTNLTGAKYVNYQGYEYNWSSVRNDDTTLSAGIRFRF